VENEEIWHSFGLLGLFLPVLPWLIICMCCCSFTKHNTKDACCLVSDDLGFSQTQLKSIGMIVHALYNNPKVLYAPNNSATNLIISKVGFLSILFNSFK